jgi:alanine racemase
VPQSGKGAEIMTLPAFARPAWAEIDLGALAGNIRKIRGLIGPDVRLYAVCKNNAYGCGAGECAPTMLDAGADAFAVSDPEDAARIRAAGVDAPILLYGATTPDQADAVAALDLIVTIHDMSGLQAFERLSRPVPVHVEVDCGYGRLGFVPDEWPALFARLKASPHLRVVGLYTHLAGVEDPQGIDRQMRRLERAVADARAAGFGDLEIMAASSRVLLGYPELNLSAVNPGRMLYGMMETPWTDGLAFDPVIRAIKSRILQVKTIPADFPVDDARHRTDPGGLKTAVIAFGFKDGLPSRPDGGAVLIRGRRARIIGGRATEHTIVDVTDIPDVAPGDEAVVVGAQGGDRIAAAEAVTTFGMPMIELMARMSLNVPRIYTESG